MKKTKVLVLSIIVIILLVLLAVYGFNKNNDTKKDKNTKEQATESVNFINNNDSYFIIIDGKKFSAGDKITDLSKVGYNLKSSQASENLPANKYMIGAGNIMNSENKNIFDVTPFNKENSSIKLSDAVIGGVAINYVWAKNDEKSANFEVYGGIKLGSTQEEVKKVFGEPTSVIGNDTYKYESDETYRSYKFNFNKEGKVSNIEWKNLVFNKNK